MRPGPARLDIDIVDYPGEWLLDLPLLGKILCAMVARDAGGAPPPRRAPASPPIGAAPRRRSIRSAAPPRTTARKLAALFTNYLRAAKTERFALSTLPPGRFLMPGDLEGSPALTFAPLPVEDGSTPPAGSLARDDGAPLRGL